MAELVLYAVGDSVMWGEGLNTENKFAVRAATSLARARGLTPNCKVLAHCGAKIKATQDERIRFTQLFPHLFRTEEERRRFTVTDDARPDESSTDLSRLHGEIPRAFPTVLHQLRSIVDDDAARVDLLLITGGANDIDFETVFQIGGDFLKELDDDYRRIFHDDIVELLRAARRKCPRALIVLTGYYSAFSDSSEFDQMRDMLLELTNNKDAYKFLSIARLIAPVVSLVLFFFLNELWNNANAQIKHAISLARATSESGESRAHYWMRKAVSEINENPALASIRGPGVAFAAPGFYPDNCMFARDSLIWQKSKQDKLEDDQRVVRAETCPRNHLREAMQGLSYRLVPHASPTVPGLAPGSGVPPPVSTQELHDFHTALDGPVGLREELFKLAAGIGSSLGVWKLLREEIARIDITRISSLFHPNREGAARYAAVVHKRAEELRGTISVRERLLAFLPREQRQAPPASISVSDAFRRFGLDPAVGVRACLAHAEPDVLGVAVRTHPTSDVLSGEIFLNLGADRRWKLRHLLMIEPPGALKLNPHLQPGTEDLFTIDVAGQLLIGDITRAAIEIEHKDDREKWLPEAVTLSIDGRDVFTRTFAPPPEVSRSQSLTLEFPVRS